MQDITGLKFHEMAVYQNVGHNTPDLDVDGHDSGCGCAAGDRRADSELRAEARYNAKVVATLKPGVKGEVTAKRGAWLSIKTAEATGWLFSFNVRFASAQQTPESSSASGLGRLFGPRQRINVTSNRHLGRMRKAARRIPDWLQSKWTTSMLVRHENIS